MSQMRIFFALILILIINLQSAYAMECYHLTIENASGVILNGVGDPDQWLRNAKWHPTRMPKALAPKEIITRNVCIARPTNIFGWGATIHFAVNLDKHSMGCKFITNCDTTGYCANAYIAYGNDSNQYQTICKITALDNNMFDLLIDIQPKGGKSNE